MLKVNEALQSNIITSSLLFYSPNVCNDLKLLFTHQHILGSKSKFVFNNNCRLPELKETTEKDMYSSWDEQFEEFSKDLPKNY